MQGLCKYCRAMTTPAPSHPGRPRLCSNCLRPYERGGETLPAALGQRLSKAQRLVSRAAGTSGKHSAKTLMRNGIRALKQAERIAARAAKKGEISQACAASVATELGNAKAGADSWLSTL